MPSEQVIFVVFGIWLLVISVVTFWILKKFQGLVSGVKQENLIKILDKVLRSEAKNTKDLKALEKELKNLENEVTLHVQKVGLVRFNPFDELGGEHSFSLALLDGKDTGLVLTGLHTREKTRVYIKNIKQGKSKYALSKEEKRALDKAKRSK